MKRSGWFLASAVLLAAQPAAAQARMVLGKLPTGGAVAFVKESGGWGIDITGAPHILQHQPARLEIYAAGQPQDLAAGYASVSRASDGMVARADVPFGAGVVF
ncbi:MAG TPA: hypothetical protein VHZ32_14380, partial [Rhizomicrobium sp.]|nr:hypothetical protein [Rhizomicrobium sp.]